MLTCDLCGRKQEPQHIPIADWLTFTVQNQFDDPPILRHVCQPCWWKCNSAVHKQPPFVQSNFTPDQLTELQQLANSRLVPVVT